MIDSAKILKLCNDIEDIVTDMDVHCDQAGWTECMEIISKIKQIGEELKETQAREALKAAEQPKSNGDYIRLMTDEELADALGWGCACCVYHPVQCKAECSEGRLKWLKKGVGEDAAH